MVSRSTAHALALLALAGVGCASAPEDGDRARGSIAVCPQPAPSTFVELLSQPGFVPGPGLPPPLLGQPAEVERRPLVSLHLRNAEVREVVPELAQKLGRGIVILGSVRMHLTFDLEAASPRFAIRTFAFHLRCDVYSLPGGTLVFERWGRARFPGILAGNQPVRTVLEILAQRAGATLIVDESVEGTWQGQIPGEDPGRAIAHVCERSQLHAARFGSVIAVSTRPLVGGDPDLDTDKDWREGLPQLRATVDLRAPGASTDAILAAAAKAGHVPAVAAPGSIRNQPATAVYLDGAPWTDLVSLVARIEHLQVRREGEGVALEPSGSVGSLSATAAPSAALLRLLAECAGKHVVSCPRLRGTLTVPQRAVAPEDALGALAALEGLAVIELGDGLVQLLPLGMRRLEAFGPDAPPTKLPDGRLVPVRLEAVVNRGRRHPGTFALVGGRAVHGDDEVVPFASGSEEVMRVAASAPVGRISACRSRAA